MRQLNLLQSWPLRAVGLAAAITALPMAAEAQTSPARGTAAPNPPRATPAQTTSAQTTPAQTTPAQTTPAQPVAAASTPAPPSVQVTPGQAGQTSTSRAIAQLFANVAFWSQRGQPELAMQELDRALELSPGNADSLAMAARLAFQLGQFDAGQTYLAKLRLAAPNDPRIAALSAEQRRTPEEQAQVEQARKLAAAGQKDQAVKVYQALFKGKIPDSLAIEYYITLGTSSVDGFKEASDGLAAVAARWPDDATFKLAYAQLQTYQESTRATGFELLQQLSHVPAVSEQARVAWHDALLWQGPDLQTRDQINAYLHDYPGDAALQAKLKEVAAALPDEGVTDRMRAYEADAAGRKDEAEQWFTAALKHDPNDAEAMIMLSLIRRRQGKVKDADALVAKAMQVAPDRREEFINDIGFDPSAPPVPQPGRNGNYVDRTDYGARSRRDYARITQLTKRGEFAAAEAELRKLMGKRPAAAAYAQLGYIQLQAGKLGDAEGSFRRVLASNPRNASALGGLATVLARQGKDDEAAAIYARLGNTSAARGLQQVRATVLRSQAQAASSPEEKARLYRDAIAADPANPWTRLEFARYLYSHNQTADARAVMANVATGPKPSVDEVSAAIYWAQERNELYRVAPLVSELPAKDRTPQLLQLQAEGQLTGDIRRAEASSDPGTVRASLIALAAAPDPSGTRAQAIAKELVKRGDKAGARDAIRAGLSSTRTPTPAQRLLYANALVDAGDPADARRLTQQIDPQSLQPLQRTEYSGIANGLAIQEADQLNKSGDRAQAYDALKPRLSADPNSVGLNLAVSRLYSSDGKPQQALRVAEDVLRRNPADLDAERAVVLAAVQAGDTARARQVTSSAIQEAPDDPRPWLMQADVARSAGDNGVALSALRKARSLRQQQLSQQTSG